MVGIWMGAEEVKLRVAGKFYLKKTLEIWHQHSLGLVTVSVMLLLWAPWRCLICRDLSLSVDWTEVTHLSQTAALQCLLELLSLQQMTSAFFLLNFSYSSRQGLNKPPVTCVTRGWHLALWKNWPPLPWETCGTRPSQCSHFLLASSPGFGQPQCCEPWFLRYEADSNPPSLPGLQGHTWNPLSAAWGALLPRHEVSKRQLQLLLRRESPRKPALCKSSFFSNLPLKLPNVLCAKCGKRLIITELVLGLLLWNRVCLSCTSIRIW